MKAIRIIERLLTQIDYHEQHVLYKNYPPVKLSKSTAEEEDDEETKKKAMMIGRKKDEKKKEEEEKKEGEEEDKDPKKISVKSLFTFECDITAGRQVSCIDISEANPDLIAVGYGEYDISCVDDSTLKKGILAFWTLKNPNFPEKIIYHDHSITCCAFSKKKPNQIAIGDSHGNIAIYNIRGNSTKPLYESKDKENKHTDIVWEVQWMQRENKGESLISISGDGRIIEWSMKKGLEFTELMQLKRETTLNQKDVYAGADTEKKSGGMTFINTGGLSIDFP
jgi:WD40 repeat protein